MRASACLVLVSLSALAEEPASRCPPDQVEVAPGKCCPPNHAWVSTREGGRCAPKSVTGGLTADEVGRAIRPHWVAVKKCYEVALRTQPDLAGRFNLLLTIGADGKVTEALAADDSLGPEVTDCVLALALRWTFPQPKGGGQVKVNYPFVFKRP